MRRLPDIDRPGTGAPSHLSPSRIAILSTTFVVLLTFIPVGIYEDALDEENHMFGDLLTYAFVGTCLLAFLAGVAAVSRRSIYGDARTVRNTYRTSSRFPVVIAVLSALIAVAALIEFVGTGGSFLSSLTSGQGEALRAAALDDADEGITVLRILPVGVPFLVWAIYRAVDLDNGRVLIYLSAVLYGSVLLLVMQRNLLIPFVLSVAIVLSAVKFHSAGISFGRAFKSVLLLGVFVVGAFSAVAFFRGTGNESIATSFMGYVPASVNRLSAVVHGEYESAFSGQPAFSLRFLWYPPLIRRFLPTSDIMSWLGASVPDDPRILWQGEFAQIASGGLNPKFIWATAFGYTFYDFSWFSCLYFLAFGLLAGYSWRQFMRRTPFGIISYSYICACIILWGTDNSLSYPQVWIYLFVIVIVRVFDGGVRPDPPKVHSAPPAEVQLNRPG